MPSALPFQPPPPCPCLSRQGRDSSSAFSILRADLPNVHPYPVARCGQARAGCYAENFGPNTQRCQLITQERVFGTHVRMLKCLRGRRGRAGAPLSRLVGARLQGALRNRPTRPCPPPRPQPPESQFPPTIKESPFREQRLLHLWPGLSACSVLHGSLLCFCLMGPRTKGQRVGRRPRPCHRILSSLSVTQGSALCGSWTKDSARVFVWTESLVGSGLSRKIFTFVLFLFLP